VKLTRIEKYTRHVVVASAFLKGFSVSDVNASSFCMTRKVQVIKEREDEMQPEEMYASAFYTLPMYDGCRELDSKAQFSSSVLKFSQSGCRIIDACIPQGFTFVDNEQSP
jgi:hypothetical protein